MKSQAISKLIILQLGLFGKGIGDSDLGLTIISGDKTIFGQTYL